MALPLLRGAWTATKLVGRSLKSKKGRKSLRKATGNVGKIGVKRGAAGVTKLKSSKKYTSVKGKEKEIRTALGMRGKGKINRARRAVQGPVGYASAGAIIVGGSNSNNDKYYS